ncbi:hypothetical protein PpBr36_07264 [Pyricularia pennisetigena]|uniref:hypothetical protein n=1 Tax=Pyricularia pennisetigena TaxID=1578925 RepID=UPI0011544AC3|nr:hypothetical protein PpBr36_07264 [Pyricularia pennisetigena]TLS25799.1 hypothetical protein PpBr36_07264 [Pyricularia pennisetigena]
MQSASLPARSCDLGSSTLPGLFFAPDTPPRGPMPSSDIHCACLSPLSARSLSASSGSYSGPEAPHGSA